MGKSKVSLALIDYLRDREKKGLLQESDTSDPMCTRPISLMRKMALSARK